MTFGEHLVSLSVADCTVNASLTTSRARFQRHNIWLCGLITTSTEESSLTRSLCCLCYTLLLSSRCLQGCHSYRCPGALSVGNLETRQHQPPAFSKFNHLIRGLVRLCQPGTPHSLGVLSVSPDKR